MRVKQPVGDHKHAASRQQFRAAPTINCHTATRGCCRQALMSSRHCITQQRAAASNITTPIQKDTRQLYTVDGRSPRHYRLARLCQHQHSTMPCISNSNSASSVLCIQHSLPPPSVRQHQSHCLLHIVRSTKCCLINTVAADVLPAATASPLSDKYARRNGVVIHSNSVISRVALARSSRIYSIEVIILKSMTS